MSLVTDIPVADPKRIEQRYSERLSFETDCWDVHEVMKTGNQDFVLFDVRGPKLYEASHVPGAINLPHGKMTATKMQDWPDDTLFVVYCAGPHCNGADKAALRLGKLGRRVKVMIGGMTAVGPTKDFDFRARFGDRFVSAALLPGVRQQLQAGADAKPVRADVRSGMDRFWRRDHADGGVAQCRQRDGRNPGAGGGRDPADPDGADPASPRGTLRQVRRRGFGPAAGGAAMAVLGQPQAHRLLWRPIDTCAASSSSPIRRS